MSDDGNGGEMGPESTGRALHRFRQIRLRTLLLLTLLASVWLAVHVWRYRAENRAAARISAACEKVEFTWSDPAWFPFGRSIFSRVTRIAIEDNSIDDQQLYALQLESFWHLTDVELICPEISDQASTELSRRLGSATIETTIFEEPIMDQAAPATAPVYHGR